MWDIDREHHNFVEGFTKNGGSIVAARFAFIVHLKTLACNSKAPKDKMGGEMEPLATDDLL